MRLYYTETNPRYCVLTRDRRNFSAMENDKIGTSLADLPTFDEDRAIAMVAMKRLIEAVGDADAMTVDAWRLHRIILIMRAILIESDETVRTEADFAKVSACLAGLIAEEAKSARAFRDETGMGLMDLALEIRKWLH